MISFLMKAFSYFKAKLYQIAGVVEPSEAELRVLRLVKDKVDHQRKRGAAAVHVAPEDRLVLLGLYFRLADQHRAIPSSSLAMDSPSFATQQGQSKQQTTISPQGRTPNIPGANPVSRLPTGPATARRPHIDRGRIMRRVRAAAEAGDEGMDVDAITSDLKPEDDRSTPAATVSPASLAPEFPAAPIQAPLPIFPTVPSQEPGKKPPHNDDAPSHAPNPQLVAVMTGEDTDGAEAFASGTSGPCSTKSGSSLSSQRSAPVSQSSIMLTSSSSVPEHVTLSTGLAARLPSKARGSGKTGPQPLPPPPEFSASSIHPSARASRSARALRANVHLVPKAAERRSEAGKRAIPSTAVTTEELGHGNSLASTAARRGRVALQIAQLNGQSASSSTDLLSKSASVSLSPQTSGSTFEGVSAPDAVEGNRRGGQAVKSVRASTRHKHASHDSANVKGEALGLGMPPAESGATGRMTRSRTSARLASRTKTGI
ncbi:hypothetical protein OC845_006699 [Tilletia horrida]|nr:hypothetical protein OC845_006699 [Tilletia horrida]